MQEEIFGPILPILTMDTLEEMIAFVRSDEKPLALYLFTESKPAQREVLRRLSFGGGCINDTVVHLATTHMGFGGVDPPFRYHPYTEKKERLIRFFLK